MRRNKLLQASVVLVGAFCLFRFIRPPMPNSVLSLYMAITLMAVLVYVSSDSDSWRAFVTLWRMLTPPSHRPVRLILGVAIPLLVGYYACLFPGLRAGPRRRSSFARCTRRRPTRSASAGRRSTSSRPTRPSEGHQAESRNRAKHLAAAALYIRNCVYCHGDLLDGQGHFASGFNPQPADFVGEHDRPARRGLRVLAHRQGRPGPPKESTPWNSAMPAWEDRLTEEQIWQVVYYLYETTGHPAGHGIARVPVGRAAPGRGLLAQSAIALGPRPAAAQSGDIALGKAVYEKRCAGCHGQGKGRRAGGRAAPAAPARLHAGKYKIRDGRAPGLGPGSAANRDRRDARDFHAALARASGEGARGGRGLRQDLCRGVQGRQARAGRGAQGGRLLGGVDPAGQEDVRCVRVRQVPRPGRAR